MNTFNWSCKNSEAPKSDEEVGEGCLTASQWRWVPPITTTIDIISLAKINHHELTATWLDSHILSTPPTGSDGIFSRSVHPDGRPGYLAYFWHFGTSHCNGCKSPRLVHSTPSSIQIWKQCWPDRGGHLLRVVQGNHELVNKSSNLKSNHYCLQHITNDSSKNPVKFGTLQLLTHCPKFEKIF